jgi:putative membrane protein
MTVLWHILLQAIAIFVVAQVLPGIKLKGFGTAIVVSLVLSTLDFFLFWLLAFLSMPLILLTAGLFIFVLNAVILFITDKMIEDFEIKDVTTTFFAAFLISACNVILRWVF